ARVSELSVRATPTRHGTAPACGGSRCALTRYRRERLPYRCARVLHRREADGHATLQPSLLIVAALRRRWSRSGFGTVSACRNHMSFDDPVFETKTDTAMCPACLVPHPILSDDEFVIVVDCPIRPQQVTTRA